MKPNAKIARALAIFQERDFTLDFSDGKKTWILLPNYPDWRWALSGAECPWCRSARLYRQKAANSWDPVYREVFADLAAEFAP